MKALVLAAGYATRLYPLTLTTPKPLLPIGQKPIIDYIVSELITLPEIDEIFIITNDKFYNKFVDWSKNATYPINIEVINDGSSDDENKLGAIGDIQYVLEQKQISDDLIVIAGDNFLTYKLSDFYDCFKNIGKDCVTVKEHDDLEKLKQFGVCEVDEDCKIIGFEEKPPSPRSNIAVYAAYFYKKETLPMVKQYLQEGNKPDAPGYFVEWLYKRKDLYAYKINGECYDIGTHSSYEEVQKNFGK